MRIIVQPMLRIKGTEISCYIVDDKTSLVVIFVCAVLMVTEVNDGVVGVVYGKA